jgi:hypothetical protein
MPSDAGAAESRSRACAVGAVGGLALVQHRERKRQFPVPTRWLARAESLSRDTRRRPVPAVPAAPPPR